MVETMSLKLTNIIDNQSKRSLSTTLQLLFPHTRNIDIATGFFEVGAFLCLDQKWQNVKGIRILMGDETTRRTKEFLTDAISFRGNESIEYEKELDDSLKDLKDIQDAIESGRIKAKVYTKMFLRFLERKGWLTFKGRFDYLHSLYKAGGYHGESFYNGRLQSALFRGIGG